MTKQMNNREYYDTQLRLEEDALGLGFDRLVRKMSGRPSKEQETIQAINGKADSGNVPMGAVYALLAAEKESLINKIENGGKVSRAENERIVKTWHYKAMELIRDIDAIAVITLTYLFEKTTLEVFNDEKQGWPLYILVEEFGLTLKRICERRHIAKIENIASEKDKNNNTAWESIAIKLLHLAVEESCYFEYTPTTIFSGAKSVRRKSMAETWQIMRERGTAIPLWSPLVIEPRAWTTMRNGGYHGALAGQVSLIKGRSALKGFTQENAPEVFSAITRLQNTPFRICRGVFEIFSSLFSNLCEHFDVRMKNRRNSKEAQDSPFDQQSQNRNDKLFDLAADFANKESFWKLFDVTTVKKRGGIENRFYMTIRLQEQTKYFLDFPNLYFVNYCDFRGRVYPKSSCLNPQGDDLSRTLLEFAEGKAISTESAMKWFKIHGANCYAEVDKADGRGMDKRPFSHRENWVKYNESRILALGNIQPSSFWKDIPCELETWWLEADRPWAFLAWAQDYAQHTNNPEHKSHLPVEVDGSCNGYQHYAALMRSEALARNVNMLPSFEPQDIYTFIGNKASEKLREFEYHNGEMPDLLEQYELLKKNKNNNNESENTFRSHVPCSIDMLELPDFDVNENRIDEVLPDDIYSLEMKMLRASLMEDKLPRDAIKKVIMTFSYSAMLVGMVDALVKSNEKKPFFKEWKKREIIKDYNSKEALISDPSLPLYPDRLSRTLARLLCTTIKESFPRIDAAKEWAKTVARTAMSCKKNIIRWVTPINFPVEQNYPLFEKCELRVSKQVRITYHRTPAHPEQNGSKHEFAIAPNFIHSCDSTHMMRTVNTAYEQGIHSFRMVHDSYATHAADMEVLSKILREEFVRLYQEQNLLEVLFNALPEDLRKQVGLLEREDTFDISSVKDAEYFFA